jgi:hypothetical protein|tara:strand:+ start:975 stop:1223 length:249 start_codon:yes stop_codon:yes gene_type:complete
MINRKLKSPKRVKKTEADIATFKLIINNQGQFIVEQSLYPLSKINLHFKKDNAGLVHAMIRESRTHFDNLHEFLEKLMKQVA